MNWMLDTDVLSQPAKKNGDPRVIAWLREEKNRCHTSAVVIAQLAYWVRTKEGKQRIELQIWLTRLIAAMQGRIFGFNVGVAHVWADQEKMLEDLGKRKYGFTIVTGNEDDFRRPGLKVFNPFKELPPL
ncbi:MAG: hypothetical protein NTV46_13690 [Verrucomicrobia bacterium]|nr:hypothetical protein [Verrucomicrobiota bacterium]